MMSGLGLSPLFAPTSKVWPASPRAGVSGAPHPASLWPLRPLSAFPRVASTRRYNGSMWTNAHDPVPQFAPAAMAGDDAETWRFCTDATIERFCRLANYEPAKVRDDTPSAVSRRPRQTPDLVCPPSRLLLAAPFLGYGVHEENDQVEKRDKAVGGAPARPAPAPRCFAARVGPQGSTDCCRLPPPLGSPTPHKLRGHERRFQSAPRQGCAYHSSPCARSKAAAPLSPHSSVSPRPP